MKSAWKFLEDPRWSKTNWLSELSNNTKQDLPHTVADRIRNLNTLAKTAWLMGFVEYLDHLEKDKWIERTKNIYISALRYLKYVNANKSWTKVENNIKYWKRKLCKNLTTAINQWKINWVYERAKQYIDDGKWNDILTASLEIYLEDWDIKELWWFHIPISDYMVPRDLDWWRWLKRFKKKYWIE